MNSPQERQHRRELVLKDIPEVYHSNPVIAAVADLYSLEKILTEREAHLQMIAQMAHAIHSLTSPPSTPKDL